MDWGIVLSVLVAMALFAAAAAVLATMVIGLFIWRIKSRVHKHDGPAAEFPCCAQIKSTLAAQK
jgi:hypothetical protein